VKKLKAVGIARGPRFFVGRSKLMQALKVVVYVILSNMFRSGWFVVMATTMVTSTKLIYVEPG